jgi:hypothetical protein
MAPSWLALKGANNLDRGGKTAFAALSPRSTKPFPRLILSKEAASVGGLFHFVRESVHANRMRNLAIAIALIIFAASVAGCLHIPKI